MKRLHQFLLIATFLPLCWLLVQAVHELGHMAATLATQGTVTRVVLHPLTISRTDTAGSTHQALVVWAGPVIGVLLPLALWAAAKIVRWKWEYLVRFFAGACLVTNGAYLAVGSYDGIGDAGDLIRLGSPQWSLWLFGLLTVPLGFCLWYGLGPRFGLAGAKGQVDHWAAYCSCALLMLVVAVELSLSPYQ